MNAVAAVTPGGFARHGGRLSVAQALFPHAPRPWVDLSTGINPEPYPATRATVSARNRLPDVRELARLEAIAAEAFGVADPERVVAVSGTECALRLLPVVLGLHNAVIAGPTYGSHEDSWRRANELADGHAAGMVRSTANAAAPASAPDPLAGVHTVSDGELESRIPTRGAVVIVNPNNPNGRVFPQAKLLSLHAVAASRGGKLVVDEAFGEVATHANVASLAGSPDAANLVVLRSFGKFYGLAGVRLGFVIASQAIASRLRSLVGDWPVSSDALVAGLNAYADKTWADKARARLQADASRFDKLLKRGGFDIVGGTSLFRLARTDQAAKRFTELAAHGVLARPFAYDATLLRFGLPGDAAEWQRVAAALGVRDWAAL